MNKPLIQKICLIFSDIIALFLSLVLAKILLNFIRPGGDHISFDTLGAAKLGGLLVIMVFWYQEQYIKRRPIWEELRLLYRTIFIFAVLHLGLTYLISHHVIKMLNVLYWLDLLIILPSTRYLIKLILAKLNLWQREVYIIGTGKSALATANLLLQNKILGYTIAGFVGLSEEGDSYMDELALPVLRYEDILRHNANDVDTEIVFALSGSELLEHANKINILQSHYTFVAIVPDITGLPLYGVELEHFFGNDQLFLRLQNNLGRRWNRIIKRVMDIVLSTLGLLILLPFFIIVGCLIKITTRSKVFFYHRRLGINGEYFKCIKFQTMYPNSQIILEELLANDDMARQEWEKDFKLKNDPRVTKIGNLLRKTSLDELPQLINVLKGEMSLVGPRPIIDAETAKYADDFYYYKLVRPGITGLWQISGRNDIDYTNRVRLDVWYVKNWSLWYDFVILFKTLFVVLKRDGAY